MAPQPHEQREDCKAAISDLYERSHALAKQHEGLSREWNFARVLIVLMFPTLIISLWGIGSKWWEVSATLARLEAKIENTKDSR